mgnify:CR=1 FL=1
MECEDAHHQRAIPPPQFVRVPVTDYYTAALGAQAVLAALAAQDPALPPGARDIVVMLDRSYSMGYGDRWDRAKAAEKAAENVRLVGFNWAGTEQGGRNDANKAADVCGAVWRMTERQRAAFLRREQGCGLRDRDDVAEVRIGDRRGSRDSGALRLRRVGPRLPLERHDDPGGVGGLAFVDRRSSESGKELPRTVGLLLLDDFLRDQLQALFLSLFQRGQRPRGDGQGGSGLEPGRSHE